MQCGTSFSCHVALLLERTKKKCTIGFEKNAMYHWQCSPRVKKRLVIVQKGEHLTAQQPRYLLPVASSAHRYGGRILSPHSDIFLWNSKGKRESFWVKVIFSFKLCDFCVQVKFLSNFTISLGTVLKVYSLLAFPSINKKKNRVRVTK